MPPKLPSPVTATSRPPPAVVHASDPMTVAGRSPLTSTQDSPRSSDIHAPPLETAANSRPPSGSYSRSSVRPEEFGMPWEAVPNCVASSGPLPYWRPVPAVPATPPAAIAARSSAAAAKAPSRIGPIPASRGLARSAARANSSSKDSGCFSLTHRPGWSRPACSRMARASPCSASRSRSSAPRAHAPPRGRRRPRHPRGGLLGALSRPLLAGLALLLLALALAGGGQLHRTGGLEALLATDVLLDRDRAGRAGAVVGAGRGRVPGGGEGIGRVGVALDDDHQAEHETDAGHDDDAAGEPVHRTSSEGASERSVLARPAPVLWTGPRMRSAHTRGARRAPARGPDSLALLRLPLPRDLP